MSIKQMSRVWDSAHTDDPSTLLVMLALADWANDDGVCWPAIATIAEKCRISERQTQRIIKSLEEVGSLEIVRKSGRKNTNVYRLKVPDSHHLLDVKVTNETEKVTFGAEKGDIAMSPEPSVTTNKSNRAVAPFELPDFVPKENWDGYEDMRRRMRCPLTDRAKRLAVTTLRTLKEQGNPPGLVLDQSTMNSWRGLFELRGKTNGTNSGNRAPANAQGGTFAKDDCPDCGGTGWQKVNSRVTRCACWLGGKQSHSRAGAVI